MITYLKWSDNNLAITVLWLYREANLIHGLPSTVRRDFGFENVDMAYFMLNNTGGAINRGCFFYRNVSSQTTLRASLG